MQNYEYQGKFEQDISEFGRDIKYLSFEVNER